MESDARAPPRLVVGVMTAPLINARNRRLIRRTMFEALLTHRAIRAAFVVGDVPCARRAMLEESNTHRDVVWINATDCHKAYGAEKVHAWYRHALHAWPSTPWLAKAEDDGLVMLPAVLRDLRSLDASKLTWYGVMGWVGSCTLGTGCSVELGRAAAGKTQTDRGFVGCCGGCFGGLWQGRRVPKGPCVPGSKETGPFPKAVGGAACPSVAVSPFPMGPIEVRSRGLAAAVGRCGYARDYFAAMSTRGGAIQNECASMDGAQGHAAAHCLQSPLTLADATFGRLRFPQPRLVGMVKVAVLAGPWLTTTGSSDCMWRLGASLLTREKRPSTPDPTERPWPWSQAVTNSSISLRLTVQARQRDRLARRPPHEGELQQGNGAAAVGAAHEPAVRTAAAPAVRRRARRGPLAQDCARRWWCWWRRCRRWRRRSGGGGGGRHLRGPWRRCACVSRGTPGGRQREPRAAAGACARGARAGRAEGRGAHWVWPPGSRDGAEACCRDMSQFARDVVL